MRRNHFNIAGLILVLMLLGLSGQAQTNVIYGYAGNYGTFPQMRVPVQITKLWPQPQTVGNTIIMTQPNGTYTDTNGEFRYTNLTQGKYLINVGGQTSLTFWVFTNTIGLTPIGSLITNLAAYPPNPATNYYTQAQINALLDGQLGYQSQYLLKTNSVAMLIVTNELLVEDSNGGNLLQLNTTNNGGNSTWLYSDGTAGVNIDTGYGIFLNQPNGSGTGIAVTMGTTTLNTATNEAPSAVLVDTNSIIPWGLVSNAVFNANNTFSGNNGATTFVDRGMGALTIQDSSGVYYTTITIDGGEMSFNGYDSNTNFAFNGYATAFLFGGSGANLNNVPLGGMVTNGVASGTNGQVLMLTNGTIAWGTAGASVNTNIFVNTNDIRPGITISNPADVFDGTHYGSGANLSLLNGSSISSGTVGTNYLSPSIVPVAGTNIVITASGLTATVSVASNANGSWQGTFTGNGSGLTSIPYSALTGTPNTNQFVPTNGSAGFTNAGAVKLTGGLSDSTGLYPVASNEATVVALTALSNAIPAANLTGIVSTNNLPGSLPSVANANGAGLTNLDYPLFVRLSAPGQGTSYSMASALPGDGGLLATSFDGVYWNSATPNATLLFTNTVGAHDCDLFLSTNGTYYSACTYQGTSVLSTATNFALYQSYDWLNWNLIAVIPINTNSTGVSWSPGIVAVNGQIMAYESVWAGGGTYNGQTRGLVALDATMTNWTAASNAYVLITNESPVTSGSPFFSGNGVNDPYFICISTNTILTNNAAQSVSIPSGTFLGIAYNWSTANYDAYTNTQASQPAQLHLAITNITSFAAGCEGGQLLQMPNGNWRFYGAVGTGSAKGRYFYCDNPNGMIGNYGAQNYCQETRFTFGQSTVVELTGTNKFKLQQALLKLQGYSGNQYAGMGSSVSVRQLPGYSGLAMAVRRSSDSAIANIGFTAGGDLDTNTILAFVGSGTGTLTTWYDQSGLGNNYIQPTNASQPCIVTNGALNVDQFGRPAVLFGSPCSMQSEKPVILNAGFSAYTWAGRNWATGAYAPAFASLDYSSPAGTALFLSTSSSSQGWSTKSFLGVGLGYGGLAFLEATQYATQSSGFTSSSNNGVFYEIDTTVGSTNSGIWLNGVYSSTTSQNGPASSTPTNIVIGADRIGDQNDGYISELILFPACNTVLQQAALRLDIMNYYSASRNVVPSLATTTVSSNIIAATVNATSGLIIGAATNTNSFTVVFTNWIDGKPYTNATGRNIHVQMPCTVTTGTGIGGNATYALTVGGVVKDAFSIGTLATSLLMPYTNHVSYLVTNGGVFAGTNLSSGTSSTAAIVAGGFYEVH